MTPSLILYTEIIDHLRRRARELGYAIGVHGSLARDIDLIACPWTDAAVTAEELAEGLREQAELSVGKPCFITRTGYDKPHGRFAAVLIWGGGHVYIDLSVMPRAQVSTPPAPKKRKAKASTSGIVRASS